MYNALLRGELWTKPQNKPQKLTSQHHITSSTQQAHTMHCFSYLSNLGSAIGKGDSPDTPHH